MKAKHPENPLKRKISLEEYRIRNKIHPPPKRSKIQTKPYKTDVSSKDNYVHEQTLQQHQSIYPWTLHRALDYTKKDTRSRPRLTINNEHIRAIPLDPIPHSIVPTDPRTTRSSHSPVPSLDNDLDSMTEELNKLLESPILPPPEEFQDTPVVENPE